jgi:hypothetical protein
MERSPFRAAASFVAIQKFLNISWKSFLSSQEPFTVPASDQYNP